VELFMSVRRGFADTPDALPALRFEVIEAAQILRMNRAQLYNRIYDSSINPQKDGARTYITRAELERYVEACSAVTAAAPRPELPSRNRAPKARLVRPQTALSPSSRVRSSISLRRRSRHCESAFL
jgi:hypothetical protein